MSLYENELRSTWESKPRPTGTCDGGDCNRWAVSMAYDERTDRLIPVCMRHIAVYRVADTLWQAEDEWIRLPFCRRSRWRWLAQAKILHDQTFWRMTGSLSPAQAKRVRRRASAPRGES